jgi:hypothetical protein
MFEFTESIVNGNGVHTSLLRESQELFDRLVDPMDAYRDPMSGELWLPIGGNAGNQKNRPPLDRAGFRDEIELETARNYCRVLAEKNEYVIAAIENRISYVVGEGHTYSFVAKKGIKPEPSRKAQAQYYLDDWLYSNIWPQRQSESVRRRDRDGESIYRYFVGPDGMLRVRFVEPWQMNPPAGNDPQDSFGVRTDKEDVEDIEGYWIDGELIDAEDIQHRKANVDLNVRRGMMTFWPLRRLLSQIDELGVYLAHLAKVRAAYAVIRRLKGATAAGASSFATSKSTYTATDFRGESRRFEKLQPGQVRTVNDNLEYEFPASNIAAADYEIAVNLLLRAVASRLAMPIWMLTSNVADMAAYTASLVAESHSVRMFQRLQAEQKEADLRVIWKAIDTAVEAGKLPEGIDEQFDIEVGKPQVEIRDTLKDAQVAQVLVGMQVMSPQTVASNNNLDYEQEQANIEEHQQAYGGGLASPVDLLGQQPQMEGEDGRPFDLLECGGKGGKPGPCPTGRNKGGTAELSPSGVEEVDVGKLTVKSFRNPSTNQVKRMISKGHVRALISPEGDIVAWPASQATHDQMADALGFEVGKQAPRFYFGELDDPDESMRKMKKYQKKILDGGTFEGLVIPESDMWIMEGEYRVPFDSLIECGGKGGKPGPCPTGRKERPKIGRTKGKKQPAPTPKKDSIKSARAKASYNPASKAKQDASEDWEVKAAKELGLVKSGDNLPMDLTSKDGKTVIEWKVVHDAKESRVNMRPDSRQRKEQQISAKKQTAYTVIVDNRDKFEGGAHKSKFSGHNIYFKKGVGAFAFNTMDKASSLGDLKKRIGL